MNVVYIFTHIDFEGYCALYNHVRTKELVQKYIDKHKNNQQVTFKQSYLTEDNSSVVVHVYDETDGDSTTIPMQEELTLNDNDEFYKKKVEEFLKEGKITEREIKEFLTLCD